MTLDFRNYTLTNIARMGESDADTMELFDTSSSHISTAPNRGGVYTYRGSYQTECEK